MPKIETYTGGTVNTYKQSNASDFADTRGMQSLSKAGAEISATLSAVDDEKQRSLATKFSTDMRLDWMQKLASAQTDPEFNTKYGQDGSGFAKAISSEYDTQIQNSLKANGLEGNKYAQDFVYKLKESVVGNSIEYQSKYASSYIKNNYEQSLDNIKKLAKVNPDAAKMELGNFSQAVSGSNLIDQLQKDEVVKRAKDGVNESIILGQIESNPMKVKAKLYNGASSSFIDKVVKVESGGNATAKNPNSTAFGAGQFTEATWLSMYKKNFETEAQSLTREEILAKRADPALSKRMVQAYASENEQFLKSKGLQVNDATLYLAHFLGP